MLRIKKYLEYQTLLVLLFAALFVFVLKVNADQQNIVVSEIMYDPKGADAGHSDWIELYNGEDADVILRKASFGLVDEEELKIGVSGKYLNCHGLSEDVTISAGEYVILAGNAEDFSSEYKDSTVKLRKVSFSLSSEGDTIRFSNDKCATFHTTIRYDNLWGGNNNAKTLELVDVNGGYEKNNWQESFIDGGTPGKKLSIDEKPVPVKAKTYPKNIGITELFPNPFKSQYEEYIELYNGSEGDVDLKDWTLHDASKSGKYEFAESVIIKAKEYLAIFKKDFKFALNNSGSESVTLLDPNGREVAKVTYDGSNKNASYNFDGSRWRWSRFLTPGKENILNNEPYGTVKIDDDIFVNVYADFLVSTGDKDGDTVKVTWDFGDGHKSYLAKTRHKYLKTGTYQASVKLSDGSEDVVKNFSIEVKEFPHPKVRIVAVNVNPKGSDTDLETVTIANKSKKKINLKGWSLATGWKKYVNHPIREDVIIKKGKTKEITRAVSSFTLNNKKDKIELRYPDGKVAHEVKYKKEEGIKEGEVYEKIVGGWKWVGGEKIKSHQSPVISNQKTYEIAIMSLDIENTWAIEAEEKVDELVKVKIESELFHLDSDFIEIELLKIKPRVLGVETVREIDGVYFFTPEIPEQEHYAIVFLKNIFSNINSKLNALLNYFFK